VVVLGAGDNGGTGTAVATISDPRFTTVATINRTGYQGHRGIVAVGYATAAGAKAALDPITVNLQDANAAIDESAAMVGALSGATWDTARVVSTEGGYSMTVPALAGHGSGAILAVLGFHTVGATWTVTGYEKTSTSLAGSYMNVGLGHRNDDPVTAGTSVWSDTATKAECVLIGLV
jgi:hypothetical protein